MGIFSRRKEELRAEEVVTPEVDSVLLEALLGRTTLSKEQALNIPSVAGCVKYASNMVSMLPIKLYKEDGDKTEEVKDDNRIKLLNDDTGDTLDALQMWRAVVEDYFLGKGAYVYINSLNNYLLSLHYIEEKNISIVTNQDPIFKDFDIHVIGVPYERYRFLKILRNTKDGARGKSIIEENPNILGVVYNSLIFEQNLVEKGGNKKGFLKSSKKLDQPALNALKDAYRKLYSNTSENVVVLNDGIDFKESSNTSVEMQLNENKKTNSEEICKLFQFSSGVINGTGSETEHKNAFNTGIMPILKAIESALNKDLLLEREKGSYYFAFDVKEMLKGSIKERYEAYQIGIDKGFMKIDEVRYIEDMPGFGIDWINLGLNSVLYDTKTKSIYTPNTDKQSDMTQVKTEPEKETKQSPVETKEGAEE